MAFKASATDTGNVVRETPRQAAQAFFEKYPNKRKCFIIEGKDGFFFTVTYGRYSEGKWPSSYKDVTKKMVDTLPDTVV